MFTVQDYANLAAFLSRAQFNGMQEAMVGVQLFDKLQKASQPQQEVPAASNGDSPNDTE